MECERCHAKSYTHVLSFMNEENICLNCEEIEKKHPLYSEARKIESVFLQKGFNSTEMERKKYHNYPGLFAGLKWADIVKIETLEEIRKWKQNK